MDQSITIIKYRNLELLRKVVGRAIWKGGTRMKKFLAIGLLFVILFIFAAPVSAGGASTQISGNIHIATQNTNRNPATPPLAPIFQTQPRTLSVDITDTPDPVQPGTQLTYDIGYQSNDPAYMVEDMTVDLDPALDYVSSTGDYMAFSQSGNTLSFGGLDDAGGIHIVVDVKPGTTCGSTLTTSATIYQPLPSPGFQASDSEQTGITCPPVRVPEFSSFFIPLGMIAFIAFLVLYMRKYT